MAIPNPNQMGRPQRALTPKPAGVPDPTSGNVKPASGSIPNPNMPVQSTPKLTATKIPSQTKSLIPNPNKPSTNMVSDAASQYGDWQAKNNANYANLEKLSQAQFSYDPETDPAYQAQRQLAALRAGDASKNAMESANEKGVFGSSVMTSQLGQIQQRAEQEAAAYIPEYRQQAYGQFQDRLAAAGNLLNQSRNLRGDQFNEGITEGQLTGNYYSADAKVLENKIRDAKSRAETPGITAAERSIISKEADGYRDQLKNLGYDVSKLGANTSLANSSLKGTRTLEGSAQDYNQSADQRDFNEGVRQSDRNFNRGVTESDRNFQYTQGRDQVADQRWQAEFDRITQQDGIQNAIAWANQNLNQAEFDDRSAQGWAGLDWDMQQTGDAKSTFTPNQVYSDLQKKYEDFLSGDESPGPKDLEAIYQDVIKYGLPEDQDVDILRAMGLTDEQIAEFDDLHLKSGN